MDLGLYPGESNLEISFANGVCQIQLVKQNLAVHLNEEEPLRSSVGSSST
jgi:hypothetical protein